MLSSAMQDVRYAVRLLWKSPLFTATAALSLAIGIGANATIFSVASALLLRPLPGLADAGRLVDIGRTQGGSGFDTVSYPNYRDLNERVTTLEGIYAYSTGPRPVSLGGRAEAERIYGAVVTPNYFRLLGTQPRIGRFFTEAADSAATTQPAAVISHELWQRRFAGDPGLVGQTVTLNGQLFTVLGVTPAGFQGTTLLKPDVWLPIAATAAAVPRVGGDILTSRQSVWLVMGGRMKPGVSLPQVDAELNAIGTALEHEYPDANRGKNYRAAPSALVPGRINIVAGFIGLLMAIVGLVLLIACVNVAGMMLARSAARRREIAVRLAIGAGRARLIRQLLTESTVLFAVGLLLGLFLTRWLTALLLGLNPHIPVPLSVGIEMDWRVLAFTIGLSLMAALLSGLAPALQASRADLVPALKAEGLNGGPSRLRLRNAFVAAQLALSLLLIIAAGLFLRALQRAADIEPGFDQQRVDVISLDLSLAGYTPISGRTFVGDALARTRAMPGVEAATMSLDLPLDGGRMGLGGLRVPGVQPPPGTDHFSADWNVVEPGLFETLRLPLLRGRDFAASDTEGAPLVAIVNEALAIRFWGTRDPIGKQMAMDGPNGGRRTLTVIGMARDAKLMSLNEAPRPYVYVPFGQHYMARVSLLVRSTSGTTIPHVRAVIRELNPNLPVTEAMPLRSVTAIGLIPQRIAAAVAGSLGVVALLLAAIGIYGVTSYAVSRRTREIGIRVALGAASGDVLRLVLRQGLGLAAIGVGIGAALAAAGSTLIESLLFGVRGLDPLTFAMACGLFTLVTLVATYIPARRAMKVDAMVALRTE
jgi:predicted permease